MRKILKYLQKMKNIRFLMKRVIIKSKIFQLFEPFKVSFEKFLDFIYKGNVKKIYGFGIFQIFLKYIFCFFIITFLIGGNTFAAGENCKIKDSTAPVLEEYITNLRKVITNISITSGKADTNKGVYKDAVEVKEQMIRLYNLSITWSDYFSYFDFFVIYPIENEYIYEIWRDYNLLQQEGDGLEKYSKAIVSRGLTGIELKKADLCKGLDGKNCNLTDGDIVNIITQLQSNNEKIKQLFRVNIIGRTIYETSSDFILVPENFKKDFNEYYNKNTTSDCSELEGSFWDRAGKAMEKIEETFKKSSNGMKSWKEALGYMGLTDNATMRSEEYERNLLKKELGRQGVSGSAANAVLNNLERFNKEGFSGIWSNNFITNSFNFVVDSIGTQLGDFSETYLQVFNSKDETNNTPKTKSIKELEMANKNIKTTRQVEERIKIMYEREVPSLKIQNTSNEKLIGKIIEMHYNINQAIKSLDGATKIAEKVCNDQAQGLGKCSYK